MVLLQEVITDDSRADVVQRMGTTPIVFARRGGGRVPSLRSVQRYAEAVGARAIVRLVRA